MGRMRLEKQRGSVDRSTPVGGELLRLLDEIFAFLSVHSEVGKSIPAEDYDEEVNAVSAATTGLRALLQSFAFKYDDTAESVDLIELIRQIEENEAPRGVEVGITRSLPTMHVNRRRIEALFTFLIHDAIASKATKIDITATRNGRFKLSDNRPKAAHRRGDDHFALTFKDENGRVQSNLGPHLAREIIGFYGGGITVSFTAKTVDVEFSLPIDA